MPAVSDAVGVRECYVRQAKAYSIRIPKRAGHSLCPSFVTWRRYRLGDGGGSLECMGPNILDSYRNQQEKNNRGHKGVVSPVCYRETADCGPGNKASANDGEDA
jgi:hypothetical protein